jgi:hypothetical protein
MFPSAPRPTRFPALGLATLLLLASLGGGLPSRSQSLFGAGELDQGRFLVVAAPIGSGSRYQLNIYEQVRGGRPCFAVAEGRPAAVNPLLASFDFTGVCARYIDANGYSLRVADSDLSSSYRLTVVRSPNDTYLMAMPTRAGAGPEMMVARTFGSAGGFLKFELEPGWRLMRRQFKGRNLGHVYLYTSAWPAAVSGAAATAR